MAKRTFHAHGCRRCRGRYNDDCHARTEDALCVACRGGIPWQLLIDNAAPKDCCRDARLVRKEEKALYHLAGRSNWHICRTCRRTHPTKPT